MTDLTQDWKDGKGIFHHQNSGYVYVKDTLGNEVIESITSLYQTPFSLRESKISKGYKVLAEVPDYTAWQNMWNTAERLEKENKELKKQVNHLSKTQARQFVDNQKLQVKAEKAKDVVDIEAARKIKQLEQIIESQKQTNLALIKRLEEKVTNVKEALDFLQAESSELSI